MSAGICTVRMSLIISASLPFSLSTSSLAPCLSSDISKFNSLILSRWPSTQLAKALRVLPPNKPSLVTPIIACAAFTCESSLLLI